MNGLNALCCVGACRFSWPLPKKGEFKLHVGYHVKDWEWYVEYTFDSYILWSGRLLKGRHVDLLIVGIFSMRVLPLLVYQGLACLLILTGHVCGQGKEIWTPSAFWYGFSFFKEWRGKEDQVYRLSVLKCTDPPRSTVCVNLS